MNTIFTQNDILLFSLLFLAIVIPVAFFLQTIYAKSQFLKSNITAFWKIAVTTTLFLLIIFIAGLLLTNFLGMHAEKRIQSEAELSTLILRTAIEGNLDKIDAGALTLCNSPSIKSVLQNPTSENLVLANNTVDYYQQALKTSVVYILDTNGNTIVTSNRNDPQSFAGKNYSFRPYFKAAAAGKHGYYFAVGVTSKNRGYYSSEPVRNTAGTVIGIAAIKDELKAINSIFESTPSTFLVDNNNIVFMSTLSETQFKSLTPLSDSVKKELKGSLQYGANPIDVISTINDSAKGFRLDNGNALSTVLPLRLDGWHLMHFHSRSGVTRTRQLGVTCTFVLILLILIMLTMLLLYRVNDWADSIHLSEKRFQLIFEHAPDAIIISDETTGKIIASNNMAKKWMSIASNKNPETFSQFIQRKDMTDNTAQSLLTKDSFEGLFVLKTNSKHYHFSTSSTQIIFHGIPCYLSFLRDITGFITVKNALESSEQKYRELTEFLPEAVFETDKKGTLLFVNKRGYDMFGYPHDIKLNEHSILSVIVPEDREKAMNNLKTMIKNNHKIHTEYTAIHSSGRHFPIEIHSTNTFREGKSSGICGIAIDLTEKKKIEEELFRKDKLEALGILAGGIAHDFNNLLTAVWAGLSFLKLKTEKKSETVSVIIDIENAIKRGKDLTNQLLTYSKGGAPVKNTASLTDLARETASFTLTGTNIKYTFTSISDLMTTEIDTAQISQVIQNLLINATESMPHGGTISIKLTNKDILLNDIPQLLPGRYIELTIMDTGCGIDKETLPLIFDPFFSTKPSGSGLGLATSFSIIKRHNGHIYAESIVGKGTSFHVLLPVSERPIAMPVTHHNKMISGQRSILLMDDEEVIRTVAEKLLKHLGYAVTTVANGEDALEAYSKAFNENRKFSIVILDLTIPGGMGGKETIEQLLSIDPDTVAIVSSGYSNDPIMANYSEYGFKGVISKPYSLNELENILQSIPE